MCVCVLQKWADRKTKENKTKQNIPVFLTMKARTVKYIGACHTHRHTYVYLLYSITTAFYFTARTLLGGERSLLTPIITLVKWKFTDQNCDTEKD